MAYMKEVLVSTVLNTASGTVVIGPVDISEYDKFSLLYKNLGSTALLDMNVDLAIAPMGTANSLIFVSANTAVIPVPSALGDSGSFLTSAVNNAWNWLRIRAHTSATAATNGTIIVAIGGHRRNT